MSKRKKKNDENINTLSSSSPSPAGAALRKKRKRRGEASSFSRSCMSCMSAFGLVGIVLYFFIYNSQTVIDAELKRNLLIKHIPAPAQQNHAAAERNSNLPKNYIVFRQYNFGQGAGNSISGLMAAHLLGDEFNRLVCIASDETDLLDAFQPIYNDRALVECPLLPPKSNNNMTLDILLLNYGEPPNECKLRNVMADDSARIVWFSGNTYPRWPKRIPDHLTFTNLYEPTPQLLQILSWGTKQQPNPPQTVVHLRHGDSRNDVRQGLDMDTLRALGKELPFKDDNAVFLVTNWLSWYTFFEQTYGWRHPPWVSVQHSAMKGVTWADIDRKVEVAIEERNLQLWADWYTIINAQVVLHTHSDFSLSACHWMNMEDSRTIQGVKDGSLDLTEDWFRTQDSTPSLSKRSSDELEHCVLREVVFKTRRPVKQILEERKEHLAEYDKHKEHHQQVVLDKEEYSDSQDEKDKWEPQRREKAYFLRSKKNE